MKLQSVGYKNNNIQQYENIANDVSFKGFYNNKALLKTLEYANDNGMLFSTVLSFALSMFVRPIATLLTPNVEKENKEYACAKSISASIAKLGITTAICVPVATAVGHIEKNAEKFLSKDTIKVLSDNAGNLAKSSRFNFASQLFKLGAGFFVILPQILMTTALIEPVMQLFFKDRNKNVQNNSKDMKQLTFSGGIKPINLYNSFTEKISDKIGKLLKTKQLQKFINKYHDTNLAQHMFSAKDILTAGVFAKMISDNEKIKENRKKTLIYNVFATTAFSISGAYLLNRLLKKPSEIFINKLTQANKNSPKLEKYIEGFKIAKPAILLGILYYAIGPMVATKLAEVCSDMSDKKNEPKQVFNNPYISQSHVFAKFQTR